MKHLTYALLIALNLMVLSTKAQHNLKKIKKGIPSEKVSSVTPLSFDKDLFLFQSIAGKGLWNEKEKKIIQNGLSEASISPIQESWLFFKKDKVSGLMDLKTSQILIQSSSPFWLHQSEEPNLINIIGEDILGFIDLSSNETFYVNPKISTDTTKNESWGEAKYYEATHKTIKWGVGTDFSGEVETYIDLSVPIQGYASELGAGKIFSTATGEVVQDSLFFERVINNHFMVREKRDYAQEYSIYSCYDKDLNLVFTSIRTDKYRPEHFQILVDPKIEAVKHIKNGIYLCTKNGRRRFYDSYKMTPLSEWYDQVFPLGFDFVEGDMPFTP